MRGKKKNADGSDLRAAAAQAKRIVVKVGSAVLADAGSKGFDKPTIASLAQQIGSLRAQGKEIVLVSSGAILAGANSTERSFAAKSIGEKQALAAIGQVELMNAWAAALSWQKIKVAQVLLTRDDLANRHRFLNARRTLCQLLEWSILPVINENDTVVVEEIKLGDNDRLSALVTNLVTADLLVLLTEVEGMCTADPRENEDAKLLERIDEITPQLQGMAGESGPTGRGGMATKIEAAREVSMCGVPTAIANGRKPGVLERIAAGERIGTIVAPRSDRMDSRKHWIAFAQAPSGRLVLDKGATLAVLNSGKSLLASGIVEVSGGFSVGDAVELVASDGTVIGMGIASYSSAEISRIKGLKSNKIEEVLGFKTSDEVIHRDHLVVTKGTGKT